MPIELSNINNTSLQTGFASNSSSFNSTSVRAADQNLQQATNSGQTTATIENVEDIEAPQAPERSEINREARAGSPISTARSFDRNDGDRIERPSTPSAAATPRAIEAPETPAVPIEREELGPVLTSTQASAVEETAQIERSRDINISESREQTSEQNFNTRFVGRLINLEI